MRRHIAIAISTITIVLSSVVPDGSPIDAYGLAQANQGLEFYVSPYGKDTNPGTLLRPFQTLAHAQAVVRSIDGDMTGNITVNLENGSFRQRQPLVFGPSDSGTNGYDVVWRSAPGATPTISGARRIMGWKLSDPAKNIWAAPVPAGLMTRQIYVNGVRAWLAFGPPPGKLHRIWLGYETSTPVMAHWRNPSDIDFVYSSQLGDAVEPICPVGSVSGDVITMAQPCWYNSNLRRKNVVGFGILSTPTYIENAYELLDQPGEFYLDPRLHMLYYIPRAREDMHTADVEVPALQMLIAGFGSAGRPIHNITFSGLQFAYATWLGPGTRAGFSEIQTGYTITGSHGYATQGLCHLVSHGTCPYGAWTKEPGNIEFGYDQNLSFIDDRFFHLGAAGLNLDNGSQDDLVSGSVFTDVSGNGLEIGNVDMPMATGASQTTGVQVLDNHLFGLPVEYHGGAAILVGYAANCLISHNQIDHTPYVAISLGWGGWLDKMYLPSVPNTSHDNVVSDNLIYDFMQIVADGGGVYTQGITGSSMATGEKITGNVVHDQLDWGSALKSDDGGAYITFDGNVLYNDIYDIAGLHWDYRARPGTHHPTSFDPLVIKNNYWQQGDPNYHGSGYVASGNKIITGPDLAPAPVIDNAGVQAEYAGTLSWRPPGQAVPNWPQRVSALYEFRGMAYVTWHPSYAEGATPVTSYSVTLCRADHMTNDGLCRQLAVPPVSLSAADLDNIGYAVVSGLTDGVKYVATVTAHNADGSSLFSIPSWVINPSSAEPKLPGRPTRLVVRTGRGVVTLAWYRPKDDLGERALSTTTARRAVSSNRRLVLGYTVTSSTGQTYRVAGHMQLISTNKGGRVLEVIGGLIHDHKYRFSISAVNPAGTGPPLITPKIETK